MINFKIVTYRTGWNFEISTYSGGTRVGAHPDSLLVLESLNDGKVTICLGIEQDGLPNATCQCSFGGQTLNCLMNEQVNLTLSKGQQITLTSLAASKARCWYYWDLIGITILANQANQYYSNHRAHLGDAIAMMIGLENYAICNGIDKISLVHQPVFEAIADAFYFEKVRLTTPKEDCQDITPALHKASYQEPWIKRFTNALCNMYGGCRPAKVSIPRVRERKSLVSEDIVLCQFDSRSGGVLTKDDMVSLIRAMAGNGKVAIIGGPDTTYYLGEDYNYRIGTISYIVDELLKCKYFVGSDSGISHLAGILGVRGYIVNTNLTDFDAVYNLYREYPTIATIDSRILHAFR